jgi:hypothetical protein
MTKSYSVQAAQSAATPLLLLVVALGFSAAPCLAQVLYGSLVGNVIDESQGAVGGAQVTITNQETNLTRKTLANAVGLYSFPNIPSGSYSVKVTMPGFRDFVRNDVPVAVNTTVRVDAVLRIGGVTEQVTVTVQQEAAVLQTDRAEVRHELSRRQMENLPVPVGRSYESLFQLIPGFEGGSAREGRLGGNRPERSQNFNVSGTTNSTVARNLDGASNMHVWSVGGSAFIPNLESIETVDVVTNSFDAEQGQAGGAVINVQLKSGGNQFHGSAFEYHYNQHLKARDYFRPPGEAKGKQISNQFGGTLGGPIKRDKLFFFTSWEGRAERENSGAILSLPSPATRSGDFSSFNAVIYDPMTGNLNGTGRIPFAENRISESRMDPIARKVIALVPLGNLPGLQDSNSNNFFASNPFKGNSYRSDNKVNWQARDNFNVFGSLSYFHFRVNNPTAYGEAIDGPRVGGGNAGDSWGYNRRTSAGANYILSPTLLMDGFFGWTRQNTSVEQPGIGTNYGTDVLGIPGTNGPKRFQSGWPLFSVSGFAVFGTEEAYSPYYRNDDQLSIRSNFTKTMRSHEIRWGVDINAEQMNHTQPEFQGGANTGPRGRFNFGTGPTQLCTVVAASGSCQTLSPAVNQANGFASFLLGLPTQLGKNLLTVAPYTTRTWRYSLYVRDRWQVTPKVTISYGTRWEYFPMPTRADRGFERYNPDDNKMYIGGVGDIPKTLGVQTSKALFAPRFGVAFRATDTLVLRAGYGISFDPYSLAKALRTNHPMLIELVVPSPTSLSAAGRLVDGVPPITPPGLGNGIIDVPGNVSTQTIPLNLERGYIQSWNFTLQKRLIWGFVGEAGYVATRQIRQLGYRELNWAPIGGGTASQQLNRRFGRTANTREVSPIGGSHYDSLQAQLQRRFAGGYFVQVAYTLSKSITNSGADSSASTLPINIPDYYFLNRSVSSFDRRHNLQIANITSLPFGAGQRWLSNTSLLSKVAGGWQVNNIISLMSGQPFSVVASGASLNAPFSSQRADLVKPEVNILGGVGRGRPYFDPTAFAAVNSARFGNAGFNLLRGPGRVNWDFGLFRAFRVTEKMKMEFRVESFNFTNTPKFGNPGNNVSNLQLNSDGSIRNLNGFGEITSASEERQFSLGFRLSF